MLLPPLFPFSFPEFLSNRNTGTQPGEELWCPAGPPWGNQLARALETSVLHSEPKHREHPAKGEVQRVCRAHQECPWLSVQPKSFQACGSKLLNSTTLLTWMRQNKNLILNKSGAFLSSRTPELYFLPAIKLKLRQMCILPGNMTYIPLACRFLPPQGSQERVDWQMLAYGQEVFFKLKTLQEFVL